MSHLPAKGEAAAAVEVLKRRLEAANGSGDGISVAEVNVRTGEWRGESSVMFASYGDLFDLGEMAVIAQVPVMNFLADIALGTDPEASMRSMYLLAVAHGVLMERARWEAQR